MTQLPLRTLGAYLLIWLLFLAVPAARTVVVHQIRRRRLSRVVWFGMAVGSLLVFTNAVALLALNAYEVTEPQFNLTGIAALFVWVAVVATTEEMMLRGLLLTRFQDLFGPTVAVLATSAIFALMHAGRSDFSSFTVLQYFADGVFLGWITLRTGDIWSAVGFHFAKNLLVALLLGGTLVAFGQPLLNVTQSAGTSAMLAFADGIAYVVALSVGVWLFRSQSEPSTPQL